MNETLRKMRLDFCNNNIDRLPNPFITNTSDEFLRLYLHLEKELTKMLDHSDDIQNYEFTKYFTKNYTYRLALLHGLFHHESVLDEILKMIGKSVPRILHHGYSDPNDLASNLIARNNGQQLDARCRYLAKEIQKVIGNIIDQRAIDRNRYLKEIKNTP